MAKKIFSVMFEEDVEPEAYALRHGLKTVNDEGLLRSTIESVIADNPQSAAGRRITTPLLLTMQIMPCSRERRRVRQRYAVMMRSMENRKSFPQR